MRECLKERKRIVLVTTEFFFPNESKTGGLGSYSFNFSLFLISKGFQVFILTRPKKLFKNRKLIPDLTIWFIPSLPSVSYGFYEKIKNLFWLRLLGVSYYQYDMFKRQAKIIHEFLKKKHQEFSFDLVQYSNLGGIGYYPVDGVSSILRISSLTDLYWDLGKGYYGLSESKIRAQIKIENESYKKFKNIIGPCKRMLNSVESNAQRVHLLSPFSTDLFQNENSQILNNSLSFFGSVDYRKGADLFLDIVEEYSNSLSKVIIAGKLYEDTKVNCIIKNRVTSSSLIEFYENLKKPKLFQLLGEIDIVILPSRVDNLPNTLLESIQMGKIVIGPNSWGFDDVIVSGYNGFLFNVGSREDLFSKVGMVLGLTLEEKEKIRSNARETFQRLNSKKNLDKHFQTYLKIIEDN